MSEQSDTGRLEAFSDGVFAVAITLLVLDIKVPPLHGTEAAPALWRALAREWPSYMAFVLSFLTVLVMWINHHRIFGIIKRSDDRLLVLNGLLLMCVSVIPFSTSLLSAYILTRDGRTAAAVYGGVSFLMALAFNAVWRHAQRAGRLLGESHDPLVAQGITNSYRFGPAIYLAVFVLAFVNALLSVGVALLLAVFFALPPHRHARG